jgi:hypothetical protein
MHAILLYFRARNELARFPTLLETGSRSRSRLRTESHRVDIST